MNYKEKYISLRKGIELRLAWFKDYTLPSLEKELNSYEDNEVITSFIDGRLFQIKNEMDKLKYLLDNLDLIFGGDEYDD